MHQLDSNPTHSKLFSILGLKTKKCIFFVFLFLIFFSFCSVVQLTLMYFASQKGGVKHI